MLLDKYQIIVYISIALDQINNENLCQHLYEPRDVLVFVLVWCGTIHDKWSIK